jgi:DNA-binding MarR family transcriptional regulator
VVVFAGRSTDDELTPTERGARLDELPPSAKLVFKVLELDAPQTQSDIAERTRLSKRTTRHALGKLQDAGVVEERVYIPDARKRVYGPLPVSEPGETP